MANKKGRVGRPPHRPMPRYNVTASLDVKDIEWIDKMIDEEAYSSRSDAIREAIKLLRIKG